MTFLAAESLQFIAYTHFKALRALSTKVQTPQRALVEDPGSRGVAQAVLALMGQTWPSIFDEEYPAMDDATPLVDYNFVVIE